MLSPEQIALLKAALLPDEAGLQAWRSWSAHADLDNLPPGEFSILPLVFANIAGLDPNHSWMPRLKGIARHTWANNQLLLRQNENWNLAFTQKKISMEWIGDGAMNKMFYPPDRIRPIFHRTAVTPQSQIAAAVTIFKANGACPGRRSMAQRVSGVVPFEDRLTLRSWIFPARRMKLPSPVSPAHHFLLASMRFAWEHPSPLVSLSDMFQIVQAHPDVTDVANGLAKQADLRLPLHAALSALGMIAPIKFTTGSIQPAASPTALREHAIRQRPAGRRSQGDNIWLAYAFLRKLP